MRLLFAACVLLLSLTNGTTVIAGEVAHNRAQSVAQNWLQRSMTDKQLTGNIEYAIIGQEPIVVDNETVGYNFLLRPAGHIIVPSRDELPVVKLYSYKTTLSMHDDSNIVQWIKEELSLLNDALEEHAAELATVDHAKTKNGLLWAMFDRDQASFSQKLAQAPVAQSTEVGQIGPLLSTIWDQGAPFNQYTPRWYDGKATLTGCVATAAAQIMKYWNYPATGQGSTSYSWYDGSVNKTLSANFASSTYNWNAMADNYGGGSSTAQGEAVAKLMSDVGIAFQMKYGTSDIGGSSAYISKGATVFPDYFGYKDSVSVVYRSDYASDTAWMQLFRNEIQNGRPVEFGIFTPTSGHAIVVDGYRDSPAEQIHLNMGWSGSYDGWYVSNNIVTGSNNWSDVNDQHAVIGIEPANSTMTPTVTTKTATSVSAAGATLEGTVNPNGVEVSAYFQYGTSASYGSSTPPVSLGSGRTALAVTANVSGLTCGATSYHYRTVGVTGDGTKYYGSDASFSTSACGQSKPTVTTSPATEVGQASATLNATVNSNGASSTAYFQYGTSTGYGNATDASAAFTGTTALSVNLSNLTCGGNSYHYRVVASNSAGTSYGADMAFTTGACSQTPPTVTTAAATDVGRSGATLKGSVNPNGASSTGYFQYGTTNSYGSQTASQLLGSGSSSIAMTAGLSGLTCGGTIYHYRAVATNSGGPNYGSNLTFSTAPCPDTTPNQFFFVSQSDVALSSVTTSSVIIVSGIEAPAAISIAAPGSYSINGGVYTTSAGMVNSGDMVTVRLTSSPDYATARSAVLTIGGVSGSFSVTTIAAAGGGVNVIGNSGFESGDAEWVSYSSENYELIANGINWGNNGSAWFAYLGGEDNLSEHIYQDVAIPANSTAAVLNFFYYIFTDETSEYSAYDTMKVQLIDPATGSTLTEIKTLSNLDASADWAASSSFNLLPYKGKTVRLKFSSSTDNYYQTATTFLLDDITLMITGPASDIIAPTVTSTLPQNGAVNVALTGSIKASFSEAMTSATINNSTFTLSPSIPGSVSYDTATNTATFTPSTTLVPSLNYTATISTGVKDAAGNPMTAPKVWSFTTTSGGSTTNLLQNGDFEQGHVSWNETNSTSLLNINLNAGLGHNNSDWYIYTGTVNSQTSATYQDVSIPANASQAYAQFWHKISTDEITATTGFDSMAVQIINPTTGSVLRTLQTLSNLTVTSDWVQSSQYDLTSYKGQTIRLNFQVNTDSLYPTQFRIDDAVIMVTEPAAAEQTLSVAITGTGSGTVNSNPSGIVCSTASCTADFSRNAAVTLMASPAGTSLFNGWTGACSNPSGNCAVTMDADKAVTANFTAVPLVRTDGAPAAYFADLQSAYDAAAAGTTIQAQAAELTGNLLLNRGIRVGLSGGYDSAYGSQSGRTVLKGKLTIRSGMVVIEKVSVR